MFAWRRCSEHPVLAISVLVIAGVSPWCIGDGDLIRGHWAEPGANR